MVSRAQSPEVGVWGPPLSSTGCQCWSCFPSWWPYPQAWPLDRTPIPNPSPSPPQLDGNSPPPRPRQEEFSLSSHGALRGLSRSPPIGATVTG